jgi:uncharacterized protein (TIGR00661 family)
VPEICIRQPSDFEIISLPTFAAMTKSTVLIAPLNWGLGHATRCVPLINFFLKKGHDVSIASDGQALNYLKSEFPELIFFELPSYDIKYPEGGNMALKMLWQLPKIYSMIKKEHRFLKQIIELKKFDLVVSDNRYGMWNRNSISVFVTHQVHIKSPFKWAEYFLNKINHHFISRFDQCWIPDFENAKENLSGELSHGGKENLKKIFIGLLSRFHGRECSRVSEDIDLLVLLSGPEPQRTILEKKIIAQLASAELKATIVRGTDSAFNYQLPEKTELRNTLNSNELFELVCRTKIVLCRSGYSSIMDLCALGKKAILVPTPGQTEQEYLADYFRNKKIFFSMSQKNFDLQKALKESQNFTGKMWGYDDARFEKAYESIQNFFSEQRAI